MALLKSKITPETGGIIWLGKAPLSATHPCISLMDEVCQGMLHRRLVQTSKETQSHLFVGKRFNEPFFFLYLLDSDQFSEILENLKPMIARDDKKVIFVPESESKDIIKKIEKKFSTINFIPLIYKEIIEGQ